MLKHFVEFSLPGELFFTEYLYEEIAERKPELVTLPKNAFAYRFCDRKLLTRKFKNYSSYTYIGKAYTLEEVERYFPEADILISNMKIHECNTCVRTRMGNWQLLKEGDTVIEEGDIVIEE